MNSIAIVTMTYARTRAEEEVLVRSLQVAAMLDLPVVIADRNGRPEFVEQLRCLSRSTVVAPHEEGLVGQIKVAFAAARATSAEAFLYVEPDKELFFRVAARRLLQRAAGQRPGLTLAARSPESFATFPPMQQYTESVVNHLCGQVVGSVGDYSYGPFVMTRDLLPRIASLPPRLGWGWRFAVFQEAHRQALPLVHVVEDLPCPAEQRHEDDAERSHRLRQLSENVLGLIA